MEVAFQCKQLTPGAGTSSSAFMIDDEWFRNRLEQCMHGFPIMLYRANGRG